jgi:hypothetical protein
MELASLLHKFLVQRLYYYYCYFILPSWRTYRQCTNCVYMNLVGCRLQVSYCCHVKFLKLKQYFIHDDLRLWSIWIPDFTGLHQLVRYLLPSRQSQRKLSHGRHVVILYSAEKLPWQKLHTFLDLCPHTIWGPKCCTISCIGLCPCHILVIDCVKLKGSSG